MNMTGQTIEVDYLPKLPRDRSVGIGCIGSGFIMADCHLPAYRGAGFNPLAIASRRVESAREVAARHELPKAYEHYRQILDDPSVQVLDIAVPPDVQFEVIGDVVRHARHVRGILAQKPLGVSYQQARTIVTTCREAGIELAVNQNMRWDHSVRACGDLLRRGVLGEPVFATIDMRAIPHWMPWQQRQGWLTLRIMSIHHLDTFRYWFGEPERIYASVRPDPRTGFAHTDGICSTIVEYSDGLRACTWDDVWAGPVREGAAEDVGIHWRVEGTDGIARGTIGWPKYPQRCPSTIDYTTRATGVWCQPRWDEAWFPDAFVGPMAELLCALEDGRRPCISGEDNLNTMALVDAAYRSAAEHRAVAPQEIIENL